MSASKDIEYSDKYQDSQFEYRHVILPKEIAKRLPKQMALLSENDWRALGVQQSRGWVHYEIHKVRLTNNTHAHSNTHNAWSISAAEEQVIAQD